MNNPTPTPAPNEKRPPDLLPGAKGNGTGGETLEFSATNAAETNPSQESGPTSDYAEAIRFLQLAYPNAPWALASFPPDRKGAAKFATFNPEQAEAAKAWIAQENTGGRRQVYYHLNPLRPGEARKAKKEDIAAVAYLHVDIDPRSHEDRNAERERIRRLLLDQLPEGVPQPTFVIDSGNGMQAIWRLEQPIALGPDCPPEEVERYTRWLELRFDADSTSNVDRILRLPGTINWKNDKGRVPSPAKLVAAASERVYPLSAFQQRPPLNAPPSAIATTGVKLSGTVRRVASVDDLPTGVSRKARVVIVQGYDPDEPNKFGASRSEWLYHACCEMVRGGCDDDTILAVITDPQFGISASVLDKGRNAEKYARRQIARAREAVAGSFQTDDKGRNLPNQHNIRLALTKLGAQVSCDLFANRLRLTGLPGYGPTLDDPAVDRLWLLTDAQFGFRPARDLYVRVVEDQARDNAYHPVCDYLDALRWDGVPRVDRWLVTYAGAEDGEFVRAASAIVLIAAVRRVRKPGCKFDEMLVLESPQGQGKSTALRTLAVCDDWFSDDLPLNGDTKRQIEALAGRWIVEAGELKGMRKGDVEALKGFLSRQMDSARLAYGRLAADFPRQCIIIGTTNSDRYLKDGTGNRRFWPVQVGTFDILALRRDRDQLWAEAAHREAQGESIRLDPKLYVAAAEQQESRRVEDPFVQRLAQVLGDLRGKLWAEDAWTIVGVPSGQRTQEHNQRLGAAMTELGWERDKRRFGGAPDWCYLRGEGRERNVRVLIAPDASGMPRAFLEHEAQGGDSAAF